MPGETRIHAPLHDDDTLRLVDVQDRHAVDRTRRVVSGGRVDHVVGADHQRHVGPAELVVDFVHVVQPVVGNIRLGQQHVHVAGHAAGDRMDGVLHLAAALLDQFGQFANLVLGLGHGHAVAGNDDHVARVGQLHGGVFGRERVDGQAVRRLLAGGGRVAAAKGAEEHVGERAVHGLAHQDRQQKARRAVQAPAMISTLLPMAKPVADEASPA